MDFSQISNEQRKKLINFILNLQEGKDEKNCPTLKKGRKPSSLKEKKNGVGEMKICLGKKDSHGIIYLN